VTRWFVAGGAGFIGSHLIRRLLEQADTDVVVFDNYCSGHEWHLTPVADNPRLRIVHGELAERDQLVTAMDGADHVVHLAANPDIAAAVADPGIDFWHGTFLTHQILEAARTLGVSRITYTSGSGVYGDQGELEVDETFGPLLPISTYGASKLAGEALVSSYCHLFGMRGAAFRFANVVGPRQTHGVVYDLVRKLRSHPQHLEVLGDGSQSKSYIHVSDVLDAILLVAANPPDPFDVFNVGTGDYVTVREITSLVLDEMKLTDVEVIYGNDPRGWKGDVPVVRFSSEKIKNLGWRCRRTSADALRASIQAIVAETVEQGTTA
jgi:UDP-glucose 4-epimerase